MIIVSLLISNSLALYQGTSISELRQLQLFLEIHIHDMIRAETIIPNTRILLVNGVTS